MFVEPLREIDSEEFYDKENHLPGQQYIRAGGKYFRVSKDAWILMLQEQLEKKQFVSGQDASYIEELETTIEELRKENAILKKKDLASVVLKKQRKLDSQGQKLGDAKTRLKICQDRVTELLEENRILREARNSPQ